MAELTFDTDVTNMVDYEDKLLVLGAVVFTRVVTVWRVIVHNVVRHDNLLYVYLLLKFCIVCRVAVASAFYYLHHKM